MPPAPATSFKNYVRGQLAEHKADDVVALGANRLIIASESSEVLVEIPALLGHRQVLCLPVLDTLDISRNQPQPGYQLNY